MIFRLFCLAICVCCTSDLSGQPLYSDDVMEFIHKPATTFKIPQPESVRVGIENILEENLTLILVRGPKEIKLGELGKEKVIAVRLPPGNYFVADKSGNKFAVPVVEGQDIQITTVEKTKSDDDWAWIPGGPAVIGDQLGIGAMDERPVRIVSTSSFWLQKTEVTNQQYAAFLNDQPKLNPEWIDLNSRKCLINQTVNENKKKRFEPYVDREKAAATMPVVMVSYSGATAYCQWMTKKSGVKHRLPVEHEWEKASRGPQGYIYSYGNAYNQTKANQESGRVKPVKTYKPNGFGLYDMTGNVFEWMGNRYIPSDPKRTRMNHALRGGSFVLDGMYLRNSFRMRQSPTVMTDDIGFRVLREDKNEEDNNEN